MHNRVRDSVYRILSQLGQYAKLTAVPSDVARESTTLLPTFPLLCLADVAMRLIPGSIPGMSHILIDMTATPMPLIPPTVFDTTTNSLPSQFSQS
jgi:hypothetical protein